MKNIENIHILKTDYPIGLYLNYCDLFIHYGSTTGIEAYLYSIPTIQLLPEKSNRWLKEYFESTVVCKVDEYKSIHGGFGIYNNTVSKCGRAALEVSANEKFFSI